MEFTGERYVPELLSAKISYEHWHRYIFASRFCMQKRVLDVACGEGYGTSFLSKHAKEITGVDIDVESIAHAKEKYTNQNVQFLSSNATQLPFEKESFDVIVSFETLEHLNTEDQKLFLAETTRLIGEDGILLISTPNKKVYSDEANYCNPYHLAEFYKSEFEEFLMKYYKNIIVCNQQIIGGSLISRPDEHVYNIDHLHVGANGFVPGTTEQKQEMEYLIAVCSQVDFSSICGSILLDDDNRLINDFSKLS